MKSVFVWSQRKSQIKFEDNKLMYYCSVLILFILLKNHSPRVYKTAKVQINYLTYSIYNVINVLEQICEQMSSKTTIICC